MPVGTAAFAGYVIGSDSAPVEIVEYADFQCPACARVAIISGPDIHRRLVQQGLVRWRFRDFLGHNLSALAHHAAACANDQGKFWEMHDQLFYRQREWATTTRPMRSFEKYADAVGLDMSQYGQCMDEGRHAARLKATHEQIVTSGIGSTPTFDISDILEGFDLAKMGFGSTEYLHLLIETKKLVFEDRARWYADPAASEIPVRALISKGYAAARRKLIDLEEAADRYDAGNPALEHGDTVYLTTADEHGNMVSLIQSNYRGMGSGMTPPDLGFCLQDRGELFDLEPGRPNSYAPNKRPFHTIIPAFVTLDDQPWMSFGVRTWC